MISGVTIAKYIQYLRDLAMAKIPQIKPYFQLDPALGGLEASLKMEVRDYNWRMISREIEKFGIRLLKHVRVGVLSGDYKEIMDLLYFLANFEKQGGPAQISQAVALAALMPPLPGKTNPYSGLNAQ